VAVGIEASSVGLDGRVVSTGVKIELFRVHHAQHNVQRPVSYRCYYQIR